MPTCLFFKKVAYNRPATFLKKETLAQVLSCKFGKISKNTLFYRTPPVAACDVNPVKNKNECCPQLTLDLNLVQKGNK